MKRIKTFKKWTNEEVDFVWSAHADMGFKPAVLAKKQDRTPAAITSCLSIIRTILRSEDKDILTVQKRYHSSPVISNYALLLRDEKDNKIGTAIYDKSITKPVLKSESEDRFDNLEKAFESFQQALSTFIGDQVRIESNSKIKQIEQSYARKLKDSEDMVKQMEEAFEIAKNSNWVDTLKKRFT